jgi:hypothetical protein
MTAPSYRNYNEEGSNDNGRKDPSEQFFYINRRLTVVVFLNVFLFRNILKKI